ncbi:hypothetical protein Celf_3342 [Cellulomonas fimi ATCC 484]|uniref:Uncharacterized protein n=1 Tax=Cellulomonas fimi (strain ATCC 484 / DSM 20113 / JCM 1341 / CCUG 24087 / LMG 16345 / NBRC 15513 / NCIMB 8980 / NCTC 7547 / NRS-133) TaxID=590998 RepID=F4H1N5_CELFA|nr:hypothetical protein Celf_3342 [Cellulomonas fimi ATCC 484]VEH36274.1 Uncharacterised protein [Cellulomonas fimi]
MRILGSEVGPAHAAVRLRIGVVHLERCAELRDGLVFDTVGLPAGGCATAFLDVLPPQLVGEIAQWRTYDRRIDVVAGFDRARRARRLRVTRWDRREIGAAVDVSSDRAVWLVAHAGGSPLQLRGQRVTSAAARRAAVWGLVGRGRP